MNVGIIGTGAIAWKHAQAYKNIGYRITACTDRTEEKGRKFADAFGSEFVTTPELLSQRSEIDYLDVCTFPAYRLAAVELGAKNKKHVLVQKPIAVDLENGRAHDCRRPCGRAFSSGVVSQHRFDDSTLFPKARRFQREGWAKFCQADAYVQVVSQRRILCAAGEGKLGRRRWWRPDQPSDPPSGRASAPDRRC